MARIPSLREDGSLPFIFDRSGMSLSGWILNIFVKQFIDGPVLIGPIQIANTDPLFWEGYLTSTETSVLAPSAESPYYLIGLMTNAQTDEKQEDELRFHVGESWVL